MKRRDFLKEINGLDNAALSDRAVALAQELMRLRFKKSTRALTNSGLLKATRRQLAQVQTVLNAKQGAS
jgi:ribosomal protein L29